MRDAFVSTSTPPALHIMDLSKSGADEE